MAKHRLKEAAARKARRDENIRPKVCRRGAEFQGKRFPSEHQVGKVAGKNPPPRLRFMEKTSKAGGIAGHAPLCGTWERVL